MMHRGVRPLLALAAVAGLAGCTGAGSADPGTPQSDAARETVLAVVHELGDIRGYDLNAIAREIVDTNSGTKLIGIAEREPATRDDTMGTLTLFVPDRSVEPVEAGGFCLDVEFNWYGYAGVFDKAREVAFVTCPDDPQAVVPPADTSVHLIVADNAQDVALAVLTAQGTDPDADLISQAIAEQLIAPTGEYEQAAPPRVIVEGQNIGVAMGDADKCVLVSRMDGVVGDVHPAKVLLQEGEYGCRPETSLVDPELLRAPH